MEFQIASTFDPRGPVPHPIFVTPRVDLSSTLDVDYRVHKIVQIYVDVRILEDVVSAIVLRQDPLHLFDYPRYAIHCVCFAPHITC